MTSFATQAILGPTIASLASREKGSFGNRADCAGAHLKNGLVTTAQTGLAAAAVGGTAYAVAKNGNVAKVFAKPVTSIVDMFQKSIKSPKANAILKKINNLPGKTKALGLIAAVGLTVLGYVGKNGIYKMGQIDQKYTDKAKMQGVMS